MGKKKLLVGAAVVVLVVAVVGLGVVIGRALGPSGAGTAPSGGAAAPSAAPTAGVNTNLDNVVAGTGATGTASTPGFEGVGTRYPATCVGAVQAAAEWTQKIFASTERRESIKDGKAFQSFLDEIAVSPGATTVRDSKRATVAEGDFHQMIYGQWDDEPSETVEVAVHQGVFQVIKCAPTPEAVAVVRVMAPDVGGTWKGNWWERNYQLQAVNGSWRFVRLIDARDDTPYQQALNPPSYVPTSEEQHATEARPVTDEARDLVAQRALGGQGTHTFVNKNGEWGQK